MSVTEENPTPGYIRDLESGSKLTTLRQHLGLRTNRQLRNWLNSDTTKELFEEFVRDFLAAHHAASEPDFNLAMQYAGSAELFAIRRYTDSSWAAKSNFAQLDHSVRFIVRMIRAARDDEGNPLDRQREELEVVVWRAFETLVFLQAEWQASHFHH